MFGCGSVLVRKVLSSPGRKGYRLGGSRVSERISVLSLECGASSRAHSRVSATIGIHGEGPRLAGRERRSVQMTYDSAGNRSNSGYAYDELNRMTASPGSMAYTNDAVGNRTGRNMGVLNSSTAVRYDWDHLNRLEKVVGTSNGYRNEYRADGMRVKKVSGFNLSWAWLDKAHTSGYYDEITATNLPTTRYFYDGQMCMEDELTDNSVVTTTKYGLGARGIDYIEKKVGSGSPTVGFPVYDAHGNMVMTLSRATSSPWFSDGLHRGYDVWGSVRWNPSSSSDIKQRYCANLGHAEDDESGLSYMRARFYEPWTGRFVSEDPKRDRANWFIYANNDPVLNIDISGQSSLPSDVSGWIQWIVEAYGLKGQILGLACMQILTAGASLAASLTMWANRANAVGATLMASAPEVAALLPQFPWISAFMASLGALAQISAAGMRVAAALVTSSTMILFFMAIATEGN